MLSRQAAANLHALGAIAMWASLATLGVKLGQVPPFLLTGLGLVIGSVPAWPFARQWRVRPATLLLGVYGCSVFTSCCSSPCATLRQCRPIW